MNLSISERKLIQKVLHGDRQAAEKLVLNAYPRVYRMLLHLTSHRESAEDLTQQSFSLAWKALPEFRNDASFVNWVRRIGYTEYLHWRKQSGSLVPLSESTAISVKDTVGMERIVLESAIAKLPEELRVTFILVAIEQLSVHEAAQALEIPEGTVKSRMFTARAKLRDLLQIEYSDNSESSNLQLVNKVTP